MEELDLKALLHMFWVKKFHMLVIIIISIIAGYVYTTNYVTPSYKASTTLILGRINSSEEKSQIVSDDQITQSEISINSSLVSTYSELIKSESLIKQVKDNLKIEIDEASLRSSITVSRVSDTELIKITVVNEDAELASKVANEIAKVFGKKVEEIYNISNIYIIDKAIPDNIPYNINHVKDICIFFIIGTIIAIAYVIVYNLLDTTIKSSEDLERLTNIKNLISIPYNKASDTSELITVEETKSVVSEAFRTLRTNVQFSSISDKKTKTYLLTSCFKSEGKSYIAANLAITFAQAGKKVILIDSDMRRGRQAKVFNFSNECGLSNYISNIDPDGIEIDYELHHFIKETNITNLNIITSGNVPPNPSELLASSKVPHLIRELKSFYDVIIFDGAPVLPITDSLILARLLDSTILVARYNKTRKDDILKAKSDIENVGGKIIGTCLNGVTSKGNSNDLNYYYYYGDDEKDGVFETIKENLRIMKRAVVKFKQLPKVKNKGSKKIRIIEEVPTKKPNIKVVKKENVVETVLKEVGDSQSNNYNSDSKIELSSEFNYEPNNIQDVLSQSINKGDSKFNDILSNKNLKPEFKSDVEKIELKDSQKVESERIQEEKKFEELRKEEEKRRAEESRKQEELRIEEERKKAEEAKKQEELRLEAERIRLEEEKRLEELRKEEERKRAEEEARIQEELRKQEEERKRIEEEKRLEKERKLAEKAKKKEERKQKVKDTIDGINKKINDTKESIHKKFVDTKESINKKITDTKNNFIKYMEDKKIKKAEKKIKAMEEQAKIVKAKLEKAEEERNKMFGKRIMFEIDADDDIDESVNIEKESGFKFKRTIKNDETKKEDKTDELKEPIVLGEEKKEEVYPKIK